MSSDIAPHLPSLGLAPVGTLAFDAEGPVFRPVGPGNDALTQAAVYAFVARMATAAEVFYVGKAGHGLLRRLAEHRGGFIEKQAKGKTHKLGAALRAARDGGKAIEVWARPAPRCTFRVAPGYDVDLVDIDRLELGLIHLLRHHFHQPVANSGDAISRAKPT